MDILKSTAENIGKTVQYSTAAVATAANTADKTMQFVGTSVEAASKLTKASAETAATSLGAFNSAVNQMQKISESTTGMLTKTVGSLSAGTEATGKNLSKITEASGEAAARVVGTLGKIIGTSLEGLDKKLDKMMDNMNNPVRRMEGLKKQTMKEIVPLQKELLNTLSNFEKVRERLWNEYETIFKENYCNRNWFGVRVCKDENKELLNKIKAAHQRSRMSRNIYLSGTKSGISMLASDMNAITVDGEVTADNYNSRSEEYQAKCAIFRNEYAAKFTESLMKHIEEDNQALQSIQEVIEKAHKDKETDLAEQEKQKKAEAEHLQAVAQPQQQLASSSAPVSENKNNQPPQPRTESSLAGGTRRRRNHYEGRGSFRQRGRRNHKKTVRFHSKHGGKHTRKFV